MLYDEYGVGVRLTPQRAAVLYDALRMHFTTLTYNIHERYASLPDNARSFEMHRDRGMIELAVKHFNHDAKCFTRYCIACFARCISNPIVHFKDTIGENAIMQHVRALETVGYALRCIEETTRNNLADVKVLTSKVIDGKISPEIASLLLQGSRICVNRRLIGGMPNDLKPQFIAIHKLSSFVPIDKHQSQKPVIQRILSSNNLLEYAL